jgi:hypothetical protein
MHDLLTVLGQTEWRPIIGDPTVVGWFTVILYFFTSYWTYQAAIRLDKRWRRIVWKCTALLLAFLGINKQLDLQTFFLSFCKAYAKYHGWYAERRSMQNIFMLTVTLLAICSVVTLHHYAKRSNFDDRILFFGLAILVGFVLIRAISFHDVDTLLRLGFPKLFTLNNLLEISGLLTCLFAAKRMSKEKGATSTI